MFNISNFMYSVFLLLSNNLPLLFLLYTEEFPAHAGTVNCLRIGRKSVGVMVTGGDDKKVNMWAVGRQHAIMASRISDLASFLLLPY